MNAQPPRKLSLLWCPECGRDDRLTSLRQRMPHNAPNGRRCPGHPIKVPYLPPVRGGVIEEWLKRERDRWPEGSVHRTAIDGVLEDFRLHADTGTPLTEEAHDGGDL